MGRFRIHSLSKKNKLECSPPTFFFEGCGPCKYFFWYLSVLSRWICDRESRYQPESIYVSEYSPEANTVSLGIDKDCIL